MAVKVKTATFVIANGDNLSNIVDMQGYVPCTLIMPSAWTTANLTFLGGVTLAGMANIYDDLGQEYLVIAGTSRVITLDSADFIGLHYLQLRSGTSGTTVTQAAERSITVVFRPFEE